MNNLEQNSDTFIISVFERAVSEHASDIHFERFAPDFKIRFRVDGVLQERWSLPLEEMGSIINSLKVQADLDITDHEIPQDGHFEFFDARSGSSMTADFENRSAFRKTEHTQDMGGGPKEPVLGVDQNNVLDIRISVYPSIKGEVVVARLLNRHDALLPLENLGMNDTTLAKVKHIISRDYGMILITGPVGAGKTTTLYSLMEELHSDEKVIMTIEDPVEFHLEWMRQSELRPARGFDFNSAMRSILRQDPDILMIGEIRDQVAAQHAVSVSLVGRIVGSTIHSNSNVGTIARLIDLQIERSMIAYAINGVISQRLVRKVCLSCREPYIPPQADLAYFGLTATDAQYTHGRGCDTCHNTGYQGRIGLFEVLEFDSGLRALIVEKAPMDQLEEYAIKKGMKTLKDEATEKILTGLTTVEEVIKYV